MEKTGDTLTFDEMIRAAEESPNFWIQVPLLEFVHSLNEKMKSRGEITKKMLADLLGVKPPTVSRWLNGNENLTVGTMCRLASALGAAVHIHVADKGEKGSWRPEIGRAVERRAAGKEKISSRLAEADAPASVEVRSSSGSSSSVWKFRDSKQYLYFGQQEYQAAGGASTARAPGHG